MVGSSDSEFLYGGLGNDTIKGDGESDYIEGGPGADNLEGGGAYEGGEWVGEGNGDCRGTGGNRDTLSYRTSNAGVTVNLRTNTASGGHAQGDTICGFERIHGSDHDDVLTGSDSSDVLNGYGGDDHIKLGITGYHSGGFGHDTIDLSHRDGSAVGGGFIVALNYFRSSSESGLVSIRSRNGLQGKDWIYSFESATGSRGNDIVWGTSGYNVIRGHDGDDKVSGYKGGDDKLYGGAGNDAFYLYEASGTVTIMDYADGEKIFVCNPVNSRTGAAHGSSDYRYTFSFASGTTGYLVLKGRTTDLADPSTVFTNLSATGCLADDGASFLEGLYN